MFQIAQIIACVLTLLTGLLALVRPRSIEGFTGLSAVGGRGVTEIRSVFGGLFIALGVVPLVLGGATFAMLGYTYLALGIVRVVSIFLDKSSENSNWISVAVEFVFGILLVL